jgi:hypothetical protein
VVLNFVPVRLRTGSRVNVNGGSPDSGIKRNWRIVPNLRSRPRRGAELGRGLMR